MKFQTGEKVLAVIVMIDRPYRTETIVATILGALPRDLYYLIGDADREVIVPERHLTRCRPLLPDESMDYGDFVFSLMHWEAVEGWIGHLVAHHKVLRPIPEVP